MKLTTFKLPFFSLSCLTIGSFLCHNGLSTPNQIKGARTMRTAFPDGSVAQPEALLENPTASPSSHPHLFRIRVIEMKESIKEV